MFVRGHYSLTVKTEPSTEPVTTAEAKEQLRIDSSDEDTFIDTLILAARIAAENFTGRRLITTVLEMRLDGFPVGGDAIWIPGPPLIVVNTMVYTHVDGTAGTSWASSKWTSDIYATPGRIVPAFGESYPATRDVPNAVTIDYDAGYGAASAVPGPIKHAMKMMLAHWWVNREEVVVGVSAATVPMAAQRLMWPYKVQVF